MKLLNVLVATLVIAVTLPVLGASEEMNAERRFIGSGMQRAEVMRRIGPPDSKTAERSRLPNNTYVVEITVETYEPARGDEQTRTVIRYVGDVVDSVKREIAR